MIRTSLFLACVLVTGLPARASSESALAPQLVELAQNTLRAEQVTEGHWRQSAALLEAATRLDPEAARYLRLLAEARLQLGDAEGAIAALTAYRRLEPGDQVVQVRLIDLHLSRMETADARLGYISDLLGRQAIAEEVRSHAAYRGARLMWERGDWERAAGLLTQALRLNPLNVEALRLRHEQFIAEGRTPLEQTAVVLQLLRANPAQPAVVELLARELAAAGLLDLSLGWFDVGLGLYQRSAQPVPHDFVRAYAAQLFLSDQPQPAEALLGQLVQVNPHDVDAWFVRLAVHRQFGGEERIAAARRQAHNALFNRLIAIREQAGIAGAGEPRELDGPPPRELPDLSGDIERIRAAEDEGLVEEYLAALIDLAWFEVYFNDRPAEARRLVEVLRPTLPEQSVTVQRLEGWALLREQRHEEAEAALAAVSEQDPLSEMGLIRLQSQDEGRREDAVSRARWLMSQNPAGLIGAMIWDGLRGQGARIVPDAPAEALREEVEAFPGDLLRVIDQPERFYLVRGQPLKVAHGYGEPLMARVTIQNLSNHPLTIGPEGVIRPDLWFDARLRGVVEESLTGVAIERLTGRLVLGPRQSLTQVVRVDQGRLSHLLRNNPGPTVAVMAHVQTNPVSTEGAIRAGAGGYRVRFAQLMERSGTPLGRDEQQLGQLRVQIQESLGRGTLEQRMRQVELAAVVTRMLRGQRDPDPQGPAWRLAREFAELVSRGKEDSSEVVSAWAAYHEALLGEEGVRRARMTEMSRREDWPARLLALVAARTLEAEELRELAGGLEDDPEPVVRAYAAAAGEQTRRQPDEETE